MKVATLLGVGAVTLVLSSPVLAQTTWDLATAYPESNFHTKNIRQFADEIAKATNGSVKITVHSGSSLLKLPEIKRSVRQGVIPIGEVLVSLHSNESPIFGLEAVPFLTASYAESRRLYNAQRPYLEKKLAEEGIVLLYSVAWPSPGIYAKKEIKSIDDLRGMKFRTFNAAMSRMATLANAVPVQIEQSDVPTAFLTNRVDLMMTSTTTGVDTKAWDFVSHFHTLSTFQPRNMVIVSKAAFEKLSAAEKAAVLNAAKAAEDRGWKASEAENAEKMKVLLENKMKVIEPTEALKRSFAEIGKVIADEWEKAAGADGQAIIKAYRAGGTN